MDLDTVLLCIVIMLVIYLIYTFDLLEGVTSCNTINGACKLYREVCANSNNDCSHTEFCY